MATAPLLTASDLARTHGSLPLFEGISLSVEERDRVALIGPNGSGKSTLLRIFAGLEEPDRGEVRTRNGLRTAFVAQEDVFSGSLTVQETLIAELSATGASEHEILGQIAKTLGRCGFYDPDVAVATLSGGWKKRLSLARGLVTSPDLLLLDEPTNHLDIDSVLWLEDLLASAPFALLFVSHDRYFIERLARHVVDIDARHPRGFFTATGGYGDFLEARANHMASLESAASALAGKVRREIAWLRQGAKARTTKSKSRIARAGELIEELASVNLEEGRPSLEFAGTARKTKELVKVEGVSKGFESGPLFTDVTLTLGPGVRLGIVGGNGSGKTTFVRMLLGEIEPDSGRVTRAPNLRVSFFDQARRGLDRSLTLKRALCPDGDSVLWNGRLVHVAGWAARFLFRTDQLSLPVGSLSGGEQSRLLLANLMREPADILFFDEPTNDLDIATLEVLEESFSEYPGTIVLVTHDRYLLDRTATRVLGVGGEAAGLYASYGQWNDARKAARPRSAGSASPSRISTLAPRAPRKLSFTEQRELDGIEARIAASEGCLEAIQVELQAPAVVSDGQRLLDLCTQLAEEQAVSDSLYHRWQELEEKQRSFQEARV